MEMTQTETKTKVIIIALQEFIRKHTISDLKKFKGALDLDIDVDVLRGRNAHIG